VATGGELRHQTVGPSSENTLPRASDGSFTAPSDAAKPISEALTMLRYSAGLAILLNKLRLRLTEVEPYGGNIVRQYVPGDDRRRVNWKSSAHTGFLMVNAGELHSDRNNLTVILSVRQEDYSDLADWALSRQVAAIVAADCSRAGWQVVIYAGSRLIQTRSTLALIESILGLSLNVGDAASRTSALRGSIFGGAILVISGLRSASVHRSIGAQFISGSLILHCHVARQSKFRVRIDEGRVECAIRELPDVRLVLLNSTDGGR
jgi:hypothetical protein